MRTGSHALGSGFQRYSVRVGNPPKEEAAVSWVQSMGKACWRLWQRTMVTALRSGRGTLWCRPESLPSLFRLSCRGADGVFLRRPLGRARQHLSGIQAVAGAGFGTATDISSCGVLPRRCAGHRFLAAAEDFDDAHRTAAAGTGFPQFERRGLHAIQAGLRAVLGRKLAKQVANVGKVGLTSCAGQEAVMADAMKAVG